MRISAKAEAGRVLEGQMGSNPGEPYGAFFLSGPCGARLMVIADDGDIIGSLGGWEHVSVSRATKVPNWEEMCWVKREFWGEDECVVQYHPPKECYINNHPHVLHLWRMRDGSFPMPPSLLVGVKGVEVRDEADLQRAIGMLEIELADELEKGRRLLAKGG